MGDVTFTHFKIGFSAPEIGVPGWGFLGPVALNLEKRPSKQDYCLKKIAVIGNFVWFRKKSKNVN